MHRLRCLSDRTPSSFGRRQTLALADCADLEPKSSTFADDLRLFATFFMGGVIFMSVYLA
ncbi:MAG: hypothetical protein ABI412_00510 [Sphingomicrobium sp.]